MKKSNLTKIGMMAVAVLLLGWLVLTLTTNSNTKLEGVEDPTKCPECGRPLPTSAQLEGVCPYCAAEKGEENARFKRKGPSLSTSPVIPITLVCLFCVLLAVHIGLIVRSRVGKGEDEEIYYYRCLKCQRKLRYRTRQIGRTSQCPLCRRPFIFPQPEEEPKEPLFRALANRVRGLFSRRTPQG